MSLTWNGTSSDSIGVIVERYPSRYIPTRRFTEQAVAGRNGSVLLLDESFPNVIQEYEVYLSAESLGLPDVASACAAWLCEPKGYATLSDSYDSTVTREAYLVDGFNVENALNKFGRCTISFSCKPQKWLVNGQTASTALTVVNPTVFDARPLLKVSGSGTIEINDVEIEVLEAVSDFYIDCETMNADDNSKIYCLDFPKFTVGTSVITLDANITSFEYVPRWWTL